MEEKVWSIYLVMTEGREGSVEASFVVSAMFCLCSRTTCINVPEPEKLTTCRFRERACVLSAQKKAKMLHINLGLLQNNVTPFKST